MDPLLATLLARNALDAHAVERVREHCASEACGVDTALLELDLIDEEGLLRALETVYGLRAARPTDLARADVGIEAGFPLSLSQGLSICPLSTTDGAVVIIVERPISTESLEKLRARGLDLEQLVAPSHYLSILRGVVYGTPIDEGTRALEERLSRRRDAPDIAAALDRLKDATKLSSAVAAMLEYAEALVEYSCFLVTTADSLRVVASCGPGRGQGATLPRPEAGCTVGAALLYGGYFVGPIVGSDADHSFFRSLDREIPRYAMAAPIPVPGGPTVMFFAENGPRGMATRWIAELMLLVSRLGQQITRFTSRKGDMGSVFPGEGDQAADESARSPAPAPTKRSGAPQFAWPSQRSSSRNRRWNPSPRERAKTSPKESPLTHRELKAVERLRAAADAEGVDLETLVDQLLQTRQKGAASPDSNEATRVLLGEVKGLFEQLTTVLPNQLALGIGAALKDLPPRIAASQPPAPYAPASPDRPLDTMALLQKKTGDEAPREVASYRSRRAKTKRRKL